MMKSNRLSTHSPFQVILVGSHIKLFLASLGLPPISGERGSWFFHQLFLRKYSHPCIIVVGLCLLRHVTFYAAGQFPQTPLKRLTTFYTTLVDLYGKDHSTANMHMHRHLKDSVIDYGPVYSFWLFSFERFNGLLGGIPTNKRCIEPRLMERFVCDQQLHSNLLLSELQASNTQAILSSYRVVKGSVAQQTNSDHNYFSSSMLTRLPFLFMDRLLKMH